MTITLGKAADNVVRDLASRREAWEALRKQMQASAISLDERRRLEVERGKAMLTKAIGIIRDNSSAEAAIAHLKSELAAISGERRHGRR